MKSLKDKVVIITGGSTGLGLALARRLAHEGCILALCARHKEDLDLTKLELISHGSRVYTSLCDVSHPEEVEAFVEAVLAKFGRIDVVVNNAGVIMVGSMESFELEEFESAMDIMYWGMVHMTRAVLPHFKSKNSGQFVNITSIGGLVAIPQLLPYDAAKFAAVGFSKGLAAELRKDNITVTTIVPGLMRTGSFINALFQKGNQKEYKLFAAMSTSPLITISAGNAAREIVSAIKHKRLFKILGMPAKIIHELHHFFPETTIRLFGFLNQFVPAKEGHTEFIQGEELRRTSLHSEVPILRGIGSALRKVYQHTDQKEAS